MNLLIAPNNTYVMPSIVMLQSLFDHNPGKQQVYILQSSLTQENKERLTGFIEKRGSEAHLLEIPEGLFDGAHISRHISKDAYYRLMAQTLLPPEVEKVLYLDGDIVITGDLMPLYRASFQTEKAESFFVVCEGPGVSQRDWAVYDELKIPRDRRYFNSGVLLMNLKLLRAENDVQTMLNFIAEKGDRLKFHDQDTLNALFYDRVTYADWHIYNQTVLHIRDKKEAAERLTSAAVIHYAGTGKPWQYNYTSWYMGEFWKYALRAGYGALYLKLLLRRMRWHIENHLPQKGEER